MDSKNEVVIQILVYNNIVAVSGAFVTLTSSTQISDFGFWKETVEIYSDFCFTLGFYMLGYKIGIFNPEAVLQQWCRFFWWYCDSCKFYSSI